MYEPTVLDGVTAAMDLRDAETFGPVLSVYRVRDDEAAVRLINDSDYGLARGPPPSADRALAGRPRRSCAPVRQHQRELPGFVGAAGVVMGARGHLHRRTARCCCWNRAAERGRGRARLTWRSAGAVRSGSPGCSAGVDGVAPVPGALSATRARRRCRPDGSGVPSDAPRQGVQQGPGLARSRSRTGRRGAPGSPCRRPRRMRAEVRGDRLEHRNYCDCYRFRCDWLHDRYGLAFLGRW